jgi:hypothetical protein
VHGSSVATGRLFNRFDYSKTALSYRVLLHNEQINSLENGVSLVVTESAETHLIVVIL